MATSQATLTWRAFGGHTSRPGSVWWRLRWTFSSADLARGSSSIWTLYARQGRAHSGLARTSLRATFPRCASRSSVARRSSELRTDTAPLGASPPGGRRDGYPNGRKDAMPGVWTKIEDLALDRAPNLPTASNCFWPGLRTGSLLAGRGNLEDLGEPLVGTQPLCVVVDVGGDHDLVGRRVFGDLLDARPDGRGVPDDLHGAVGVGKAAFGRRVGVGYRFLGARQRPGSAAAQANPGELHRGGDPLRVLARFSADDGDREDGRGTLEGLRRLEAFAVRAHGGGRVRRAEVRGEGVPEAHLSCRLRGVAAGTEQPDRRQPYVARHGDHRAERVVFGEPVAPEGQKLAEPLREVFGPEPVLRAAQRRGRHGVGAGGAAYAEVDPPWVQRLENPEGFDDPQRGVVREHDPAGADPDTLGDARDVPDHDLRRRAGDARQVVVLGEPVPPVAEPVDELGQIERVAERPGAVRARADRRDVEDGEIEIHVVFSFVGRSVRGCLPAILSAPAAGPFHTKREGGGVEFVALAKV